MSVVAVAVIVGFVCCSLGIRALALRDSGASHGSSETGAAAEPVRRPVGTPVGAMMDE